MRYFQGIRSIFILLAVVTLASCGSGSGGSSTDGASGRVSLLITDGPTTDFDQINITLESISFIRDDDDEDHERDEDESDDSSHEGRDRGLDDDEEHADRRHGSDNEDDDDDDSRHDDNDSSHEADEENHDGREVIVFDEVTVINLLALQNYSDLLTTATIPAGSYSKIRLRVSEVELVKLNADGTVLSSELAILPGNGKIDLKPRTSFDIVDGGHLMIELDVDAEKSIHIVETGSGRYIFRPVIFVNILGEQDLKLVMLDGRVFDRTDTGFQLCDVDAVAVDDRCLEVILSDNTSVQNAAIDVVAADVIVDDASVTVLGKASSRSVNALHVVVADAAIDTNNPVLFTGLADSVADADNVFSMTTDDDNDLVAPETALSVTLADGARIFDKFGTDVGVDSIIDGSDVDVFGLALPELSIVDSIRAAFVIVDNKVDPNKKTGTIVAVNEGDSEITVSIVSETFSGDVCVDVGNADMFLLDANSEGISSVAVSIAELSPGMSVDIYGRDDSVHSEEDEDDHEEDEDDDDYSSNQDCESADVLLITAI